jgi:hypothetical protein
MKKKYKINKTIRNKNKKKKTTISINQKHEVSGFKRPFI